MNFDVEIKEHVHIVLHVPEDILLAYHYLIKDILLRDFECQNRFNHYYLKKKDDKGNDNSDSLGMSLLRLYSYLMKENIPHRLSVIADPYSVDETVKFSYFFWFDSEGVKKDFKYIPYIPTERDFLNDEHMIKLNKAGNHTINYVHALGEFKAHSTDSPERTSRPSQMDLRHLYLSKQFLST